MAISKEMSENYADIGVIRAAQMNEAHGQFNQRINASTQPGVIPSALGTVSLSAQTVPSKTLETNIAREEYLEKTQSMRVVALNEACSIAKAMIEKGAVVDNTSIVRLAGTFAAFLVDART